VPEALIRRVIVRESGYNPRARHGAFWGLMQIRYDTARSMGYRGPPAGLLEADTNLRYGVKYLAGAYRVAFGDPDKAVSYFATGYYYDAKRRGLLEEVGLKRGK
jgi:soluble lytic murein transglycosylase-like protein